jgi:large subunit ribosomal protein L15
MRGFEGGQMPLVRRVPKRGFTNIFKKQYSIVNLEAIEKSGLDEVTYEAFFEKRLARRTGEMIKVLGNGKLTRKIKIHAHKFSESALKKIKKSGGEAILIEGEGN